MLVHSPLRKGECAHMHMRTHTHRACTHMQNSSTPTLTPATGEITNAVAESKQRRRETEEPAIRYWLSCASLGRLLNLSEPHLAQLQK